MTGASVSSSTVMVCALVVALPCASMAVQVRVCTVLVALVTTSSTKLRLASLQLSVAVACAKTGVAAQLSVLAVGRSEMTGASVSSSTVMVCALVVALPCASMAVQVRVCTVLVALVTTSSTKLRLASLQLSVAVACAKTGVAAQLSVLAVGRSEMTGASVSKRVVMLRDATVAFPQSSVAVQVRVCTSPRVVVVVRSSKLIVTPPQRSVAVGVAKKTSCASVQLSS